MRAAILAGCLTLALLRPALAADDCRAGASLLADQRALAALRAATEEACPCAAYTGGPGRTRKAYQRCARGALETALGAGDLRAECVETARRTNRGATCGTSKVACGRVRAGEAFSVLCKTSRAAGCVSRRAVTAAACGAETHCADVVEWTAGTCTDPRDPGPFAAGARVVTYTKDSVASPGTPRDLETAVWYPAPPGSGPIDGLNGAVLDAPLDASGGPYPLLMFSHGSCGYPQQSTFLTANLASHGWIVAAPAHTGNTIYQFPTCGTPAAQVASFQERPRDVLHVLDALLAEDQDPGALLYGAIDETRIAMSGHSFGGLTTYLVVPLEPRFRAAIPMAPAALFDPALAVPSLQMIGAIDAVVDNEQTRTGFADDVSPKYLVEIANTGHYAFSNGCFPSPDCDPPATLTQDEAHAAVLRWVLPFLERHVGGDETRAPFFAGPVPPGFAVDARP
jgi:dienelactone hydrolase